MRNHENARSKGQGSVKGLWGWYDYWRAYDISLAVNSGAKMDNDG